MMNAISGRHAIFDSLVERFATGQCERQGDHLVVRMGETAATVSEDVVGVRLVLWAELMPVAPQDAAMAAMAAAARSLDTFDRLGVTVGMTPDSTMLVIGRSVERNAVDTGALKRLLESLATEAPATKRAIQTWVAETRSKENANPRRRNGHESVLVRA